MVVAMSTCIRRTNEFSSGSGGLVRVKPASLLRSFLPKARCSIEYQPKSGGSGTIVLSQSLDGQVAMVIPGTNGDYLLCLYYADVHYRLMKIDPHQQFAPFPKNSYLNYIILTTPWNIEEGTSNDWEEAHSYLKAVPQSTFDQQAGTTYDLGIVRFHFQREELLAEVEREIYNSQHGLVY